jgi:hypothetical protein
MELGPVVGQVAGWGWGNVVGIGTFLAGSNMMMPLVFLSIIAMFLSTVGFACWMVHNLIIKFCTFVAEALFISTKGLFEFYHGILLLIIVQGAVCVVCLATWRCCKNLTSPKFRAVQNAAFCILNCTTLLTFLLPCESTMPVHITRQLAREFAEQTVNINDYTQEMFGLDADRLAVVSPYQAISAQKDAFDLALSASEVLMAECAPNCKCSEVVKKFRKREISDVLDFCNETYWNRFCHFVAKAIVVVMNASFLYNLKPFFVQPDDDVEIEAPFMTYITDFIANIMAAIFTKNKQPDPEPDPKLDPKPRGSRAKSAAPPAAEAPKAPNGPKSDRGRSAAPKAHRTRSRSRA